MAEIKLHGAPDKNTPGSIGDICTDLITGKRYECTSVYTFTSYAGASIAYQWEAVDFPSNVFVVNVTQNKDGSYTADKTFAEITEAYECKKIPMCYFRDAYLNEFSTSSSNGVTLRYNFTKTSFLNSMNLVEFVIAINNDNSITINAQTTNIGLSSTLTTTDKTITGAINELKAEIDVLKAQNQ